MERNRPLFHFTPQKNWMNDPNGLIFYNGKYHLFYQYNPEGPQWGHMSWGHATSTDLIHWSELPVAIPETERDMIFSGSAVFDSKNSSGLGTSQNPPLVAIYTALNKETKIQSQALAFSVDEGLTWQQYENNPVIDVGLENFRDPKVFWDQKRSQWLMALVRSEEHKVSFYSSQNLKDWRHLSDFGSVGSVEGVWECPDLFELPVDGDSSKTQWVLIVSLNPGGPQGGSGTQYFIGDFDGETFTSTSYGWLDYGSDYYAAVSYNDAPNNRRIMIGWMSNWRYASKLPQEPFTGVMSIARAMSLKTMNNQHLLISEPINVPSENDQTLIFDGSRDSYDFGNAIVGYDTLTSEVYVRRTSPTNTEHRAPARIIDGKVKVRAVTDIGSIELFINDGEASITELVF